MKRSEMISYLSDKLYDTSIDRTEEQCKATADFILSLIEAKGMLPPCRGNKVALNTVADEIDCSWEPECEIPEYAFKCNNCTCED